MAHALEVGDQGRQARAYQPCFAEFVRERSVMHLLARTTPTRLAAILENANRFLHQLYLLQDTRRAVTWEQLIPAAGAVLEVEVEGLIDLPRKKRGAFVARVAGLAPYLALLPVLRTLLGRFDDVARRWFRRRRGVLLEPRDQSLKLLESRFELGILCFQLTDPGRLLCRLPPGSFRRTSLS